MENSTSFQWPGERHTCHSGERFVAAQGLWRAPRIDRGGERRADSSGDSRYDSFTSRHAEPFRTCDYCGSMHPEDLYRALVEKGARLGASDWKYGWPHKWYVEDLPSPLAGERVCVGTTTRRNAQGVIASEPNWGVEGATTHAKFYNVHLLDDGFNAAARDALVRVIWKHTGIFFEIEQDKFRWIRRPYEESNAR